MISALKSTFFWHYLRHSFLREPAAVVFTLALSVVTFGGRLGFFVVVAGIAGMFAAILVLNYLAWRSLGRLMTSEAERKDLSADELANLAWSFWWRPARKPKV